MASEVNTAVRVHAETEEAAEKAAAETETTETETAEKAAAEKAAAAKVAAEKAAANQVAAAKVEAEKATGEKNKAAAKLQAAQRGKGSRAKAAEIKVVNKKKVKEEKLAEENAAEAEEKAAAEKAATKVQAAKRGKDGRIKVEKAKEDKAATKLQAAKRGKDGREKVKKNQAATNTLQAAKQDNQALEKQANVLAVTSLSALTPAAAFVEGLIAAAVAGSPSDEVAQARAATVPASYSRNTSPGLDTPGVHPDNLGIRLFNDGEEVQKNRPEPRRALPAPPPDVHMPAVSTFTMPEPKNDEIAAEEKAAETEQKVNEEKAAEEKVKEDKAATKLQAAKRGKDGREKVKKNKAAAAADASAMEEAEREEVAAREEAATKLQARVRGQGVRRHATESRANCPNESLEGPWDEEIRLSATRVQAQARGRGVERQRAANYAKEAEALTREAEALLYRYKSIAEEAEEALEEALDTSASGEGIAPPLDAVHNSLYVSETWSDAWPEASAGHSPREPLAAPVPARSLQWAPMLPQPRPPPESPLSLSRPPSPRLRSRTPCEVSVVMSIAQQVGAAWLWPEPTAQLSMERRPLTPMIPYLTPNQSHYPNPRPKSTPHSKPWEVTSITVAGSGLSGCTTLPAPMQVAVHRYDASWMPRNLPTTTAIDGISGSLRNSLPVISHIGNPIRASSPYPSQEPYEYPYEYYTSRPDHLQPLPPTSPRGSQLAFSRSLSPGSTLPNRPLTPRTPHSARSKTPEEVGPIVSTEALRLLPLQSSWTRPAFLPRFLSSQLHHSPGSPLRSPHEALELRQWRPASVSTSRRDAMAMRPRLHIAGLLDELESWPVAVPLALIQTA